MIVNEPIPLIIIAGTEARPHVQHEQKIHPAVQPEPKRVHERKLVERDPPRNDADAVNDEGPDENVPNYLVFGLGVYDGPHLLPVAGLRSLGLRPSLLDEVIAHGD